MSGWPIQQARAMRPKDWAQTDSTLNTLRTFGMRRSSARTSGTALPLTSRRSVGSVSRPQLGRAGPSSGARARGRPGRSWPHVTLSRHAMELRDDTRPADGPVDRGLDPAGRAAVTPAGPLAGGLGGPVRHRRGHRAHRAVAHGRGGRAGGRRRRLRPGRAVPGPPRAPGRQPVGHHAGRGRGSGSWPWSTASVGRPPTGPRCARRCGPCAWPSCGRACGCGPTTSTRTGCPTPGTWSTPSACACTARPDEDDPAGPACGTWRAGPTAPAV